MTHGRSKEGITYDKETGRCRDDQGQFVECPPGMEEKGGSSRGGSSSKGEASHGGRGSSRSGK